MPDRRPLTPGHAARILARAAITDNREPAAAADEVWAATLTRAGLTADDYRDCVDAVDVHYGQSTERIMPAHLIAIVRGTRREAAERQQTADHLALTDGRPAEGSPEAAGVLARLTEVTRRTNAAGAAVLLRPETRTCRDTACGGTVSFEPSAERGICDGCGRPERRFAPGYGLADRGFALDIVDARVVDRSSQAWLDQFAPGSRRYPGLNPGDEGLPYADGEAWVPDGNRPRLTRCGCGPTHSRDCPAGLGVGQ